MIKYFAFITCLAVATPVLADDTAAADVKAGTGVEKHQIVGEAASFTKGTTVFVWSSVSGAEPGVKHVWKLDGKPVWTANLPVKSKKWSTQSRRMMTKPGAWEVDVTKDDGTSIATVAFTITE